MRLTWSDVVATVLVAASSLLFALWTTGAAFAGASTRVVGAIVFGLGIAACTSDRQAMASVYGAEGQRRAAPIGYVVVMSLLGATALIAGVLTLAAGSEAMLATLAGAMLALWVLATIRHAGAGSLGRSRDAALPRP
jgi:hypothetical protein